MDDNLAQRHACDLCYKRKRRCRGNGLDACDLCLKKGVQCMYSPRGKRGPKRKQPVDSKNVSSYIQNLRETSFSSGPGKRVDTVDSISPLSKIFRLSPSIATGLLGLEENNYLYTYLSSYEGVNSVPLENLQRSIVQFQFTASVHRGNASNTAFIEHGTSADHCALWTTIAHGALLQGIKNDDIVEKYLYNARESIKEVYDEATSDVLGSYLMLAKVYASLENYPMFTRYLGFASVIAQVIGKSQYSVLMKNSFGDTGAERSTMPLNEDLWFILEALSLLKKFVTQCGPRHNVMDTNKCDISPHCIQDLVGSGNNENGSSAAISCFAPNIEGLPTSPPDTLEALLEEGGCMFGHKAKQLVRNNIVSSALTSLADPNATAISSLVNAATKGKTSLLPVVMSINYRVAQVMHLIYVKSTSIARFSGAKLELVVERILQELGPSFIARGGFLPHKISCILVFLKLLAGDEEGCLSYLLSGLAMLRNIPGLLRFPAWRQDITWCAGLLRSAGFELQYDELVSIYNGLKLGGGSDILPNYADAAADTWHCRGIPGKAIYKMLKENIRNGTAQIFINLPLCPVNNHCIYTPHELPNKIESNSAPSPNLVSDYSSAAESPLGDFVYYTNDMVKNEGTNEENEAFSGEFNQQSLEDLEMLNILASGIESSYDDFDTNIYIDEMWQDFDNEFQHLVQDDAISNLDMQFIFRKE